MAIPISALAKTGASLIPSPTNNTLPFPTFLFKTSSNLFTLSLGNNSEYTSSIPISFATFSATSLLSPVSITVFLIPAFFNSTIASFTFSFISSEIIIFPLYSELIAI